MKQKKECDHKWINMEDGSLDQFCVRCSNKQKQAVMASVVAPMAANITVPIMRERMDVPLGDGRMISADKEDWMKQFRKHQGLHIGIDLGKDPT